MLNLLILSGPIGMAIVLASVFALAAFFERLIRLHQAQIDTESFLKQLSRLLTDRNVAEAVRLCDRTPSPVTRVAREGLVHVNEPQNRLQNKIEAIALAETPKLERNMSVISTIAHVAPLLGLLGTVTGMIKAFQMVQVKGTFVTPGDMAGGIWEALLTTAEGLIVAIPCVLAYHYLLGIIQAIRRDMERAATLVVDFALTHYEIPVAAHEHRS